MAIFKVTKKSESKNKKNVRKIVGGCLIAAASVCFLFSVTSIWPALQFFLRGVFGLFIYPLSVLLIIIGLALLNNKKYVMPKKYAIFLTLSIVFLLCLVQLIILGPANEMSFGEYLGRSYTHQLTAGGILIGLINTMLVVWLRLPASYIIVCLGLVVSVAFFVEAFISNRKSVKEVNPVKIQIKEKTKKVREAITRPQREEVNVVLNGQLKEELSREQIAKDKLGLSATMQPKRPTLEVQEEPDSKIPQNMTLKEYLLSPPKVDLNSFMARSKTKAPQVNKTEMKTAFEEIKNEPIKPSSYVFEEEYNSYVEPQKRGNLPSIKPEELVSEADEIIRSVAKEEFQQMEIKPEPMPAGDNYNFDRDRGFDRSGAALERNSERSFDRSEMQRRDNFESHDDIMQRERPIERPLERSIDSRFPTDRASAFDRSEQKPNDREFIDYSEAQKPKKERKFVSLDDDEVKSKKPYKYNKPSIDLITTMSDDLSMLNTEVPAKRVALENALENFGVPAKVQSVVIGPTVTRYEIAMPEGISVKKILSLDADIAYALSARGEIRIEAPIPGRSIVGIEVPNDKVAKVSIKDVLQSKEFTMSPSPLAFALGKDITGGVRVCNLQKMPHLLVAGTTGSGKSVCLNAIIVSILYKASPEDVKFIMIDPKQVELSMYEGLPHMVIPKVITDPVKAVNALSWAVEEMEKRFNLISDARVRNIDEYNKIEDVILGKKKKMPFLVIIFDEFADFMLVAKNEIEDKIRRLAQKARAAGIHLILATQRPSTDVVTGTIKANFPGRIAFKVAGRVDSEVIMGATGAEKLLGYGDMLYKPTDASPARIQGCFIDTPETKDIVNYIIQNNDEDINEEAMNAINSPGKSAAASENDSSNDPLLPQALKLCIDAGVASTTMVQRKLAIGYPRAARIIDQMFECGYISGAEGSKQRSVYTTIEEYYQIFGDMYD